MHENEVKIVFLLMSFVLSVCKMHEYFVSHRINTKTVIIHKDIICMIQNVRLS